MADTDKQSAVRGGIPLDERLGKIDEMLERIVDQLGNGAEQFAVLSLRLRAVEIIVYGGCGVILLAVLSAALVLVVGAGHAQTPPAAIPAIPVTP